MSRVLKTLALSVSLLVGQQALAQTVPEPQPVPYPATGIPAPTTSGNSGLLLTIYDITNTASLTLYTGLNFLDILPGSTNMTSPDGFVLDFGTVQGFDTLVANASAGLSSLRYAVYAGDNLGAVADTALATTSALGSSPTILNSAVTSALGAIQSLTATMNSTSGCTANPCTNVDAQPALSGTYLASASIAPTASVGTALGFYLLDVTGSAFGSGADELRYQNSPTSFGQWLLSSTGNLKYSIGSVATVVPVPAAIWLLLSGLGGIGVLGRRRTA
jgi:hypothetical protein